MRPCVDPANYAMMTNGTETIRRVSLPRHHYECRSMDAMWLLVVAFVLAAILVVIATSVGIACFRVLSNSEMTAVNRIA
jgi:small neutral amino acid transporter SnatA (MarC family)